MQATYSTGGMSDPAKTKWNPNGLGTNCGFCAISYALEQQNGNFVKNADELYDETLAFLGIEKLANNGDPLPRMLVFSQPNLDQITPSVEYSAIRPPHTLSDYTIEAVAGREALELKPGDKYVANALLLYATRAFGKWTLDDFIQARSQRPGLRVQPSFATMKKTVEDGLRGNAIIGGKDGKHFLNMSFDHNNQWKLFDPQSGRDADGLRAKALLGEINLFERYAVKR